MSSAEAFYGAYRDLLEEVVDRFARAFERARANSNATGRRDAVASWQSRLKTPESMRAKLKREGLDPTADNAVFALHDAAGVRIICPFVEDVAHAACLVRQLPGFSVVTEKDYVRHPKPSGYRSYHMILRAEDVVVPDGSERPLWLEVQLRTLAMDCWANIEHHLKYKKDIPDQELFVAELKRCADEMASTDLSLQTLADLIEASNTPQPAPGVWRMDEGGTSR